MNYEVATRQCFSVIGLQVELTRSQNENHKIIARHWKRFNHELRKQNIKFDNDWLKYGVTRKIGDHYTYLTAIPKVINIEGFLEEELKGGKYLCFEHKGDMGLLKSTIHGIYKTVIPGSKFELDHSRTVVHYEQYDHRFLWNNPNSIIELYVPIKSL